MTRFFGLSMILLVALASFARGLDLPEPTSINADMVMATKDGEVKVLKGVVINNNFVFVDLRKDKSDSKGIKIPQSAIRYVFYAEADNSAYIDGLKAYNAHKYSEAAEAFVEAGQNLKNFKSKNQSDEFIQYVQYYAAMSNFRLGIFDKAIGLFNLALQPRDAIFKFQGEYYLARSLEAQGKFQDAESKYSLLVNAVFPELLKKAAWGEKWNFLCKLGRNRASLMAFTQKPGQAANVEKTLAAFDALIKEGGDNIDDEVKSDALMIRTSALKYLAKDKPENYNKIISLLAAPVRNAVAVSDRSSLRWMYLDLADSYWGLMESSKDAAKKKEFGQEAFFEYLRLSMVYDVPPAEMCKIYYRLGRLFQILQGTDWKSRAENYYKMAASGKYKEYQPYVFAQDELKKLKK